MNKNAFSRKMINQYYEEMAVITEENTEIGIDTPVIDTSKKDPLWDCWYEVSFLYEPECTKDAVQMTVPEYAETDDFEDLFEYESYVPNSKDERRMSVSKRRKNAALHKQKPRRTVQVIWDNYVERAKTDMQNWSFQKRKNGEHIDAPKSQEGKADKILKRALKASAVPEKLRDEITKHLESLHDIMSCVMGDKNCYERHCREAEAKVKQELEEKMAA